MYPKIQTNMCIYIYIYVYVYMYIYTYIHIGLYIYMYAHISIYAEHKFAKYIYIYVNMNIFANWLTALRYIHTVLRTKYGTYDAYIRYMREVTNGSSFARHALEDALHVAPKSRQPIITKGPISKPL